MRSMRMMIIVRDGHAEKTVVDDTGDPDKPDGARMSAAVRFPFSLQSIHIMP